MLSVTDRTIVQKVFETICTANKNYNKFERFQTVGQLDNGPKVSLLIWYCLDFEFCANAKSVFLESSTKKTKFCFGTEKLTQTYKVHTKKRKFLPFNLNLNRKY